MRQKALIVAINDYQSINDLRGCLNDAENIRALLKSEFGFTNNDIRVLTDSRATRPNIAQRLEWLLDGIMPGDRLFLHFSGHGSQIRDRDGDELRDHMDEILCLYDMTWDGGYITDDEIGEWLQKIPVGVATEIIFDCCHSGGGEGEFDQNVKVKQLNPPFDITSRAEGDNLPTKRIAVGTFTSMASSTTGEGDLQMTASVVVNPPRVAIWSGCGEAQTSADAYISGSYNGAFTYYWCQQMRQGRVGRSALLARVKNSLSFKYSQVPELTCNDLSALTGVLT